MKIGIYLENYRAGGVDRVIVDTINHWPNSEDTFVIFCNRNHEGMKVIADSLNSQVEWVLYDVQTSIQKLSRRGRNSVLRKLLVAWYIIGGCYLSMPVQIYRFKRLFRAYNIDAVYIHNGGWPAARSTRSAILAARLSGIAKVFLVIHNLVVRNSALVSCQEKVVEKLISPHCDVVTVSNATASSLLKFTRLKEPLVIPNGIRDISSLISGDNCFNHKSGFSIVAVGTFEPRRGHEILFKTVKMLIEHIPDLRLYVAGTGTDDEVNRINSLLSGLDLKQHVRLLGFRTDVPDIINACDVVINTVQEFESFGLVAVEAMALHKPVVSSNIDGIPEVVIDGETGLLAAPGDVGQFAKHLLFLHQNKDYGKLMGEKGYERYMKHFRADLMAASYANLIKREDSV